jgi:hypothetical protein
MKNFIIMGLFLLTSTCFAISVNEAVDAKHMLKDTMHELDDPDVEVVNDGEGREISLDGDHRGEGDVDFVEVVEADEDVSEEEEEDSEEQVEEQEEEYEEEKEE